MAFTLTRRTLTLTLAAAAASLALASPASAAGDCTKYAAPGGSDSAAGSEQDPFRTAQKLAYSLRAGDVGCLRSGTYEENVELTESGTDSARIKLQSYPGERARILGELAIRAGADYTTVRDLDLNGKNPGRWASPSIAANHVAFEGNDITNDHTAICFLIGTRTRAQATLIKGNRIHDCGEMPATNLQHGIYVQSADGTQIVDNLIYDNADLGIQLYPDAQRTLVRGNVIDGNGEGIIFSGEDGKVANNNVVENNVITNSRIRWNVEYYYNPGEAIGEGNVVRHNCVHGGVNGEIDGGISRQVGFTASDNIVADPQFVNRAAKDFSLAPNSPCAELLGGGLPPASQPDAGQAPPASSGHVILHIPPVVGQGAQQLPASGQVSVPPQANTAPRRRVLIQRRTKRGWRTVARAQLRRGSHFRTRVRMRARRGQRVIKMRAVVREVASSRVRRVKVRRR